MSFERSRLNSSCSSRFAFASSSSSARSTPTWDRSRRGSSKPARRKRGQRQFLDLGVGFQAGVAVDLGADLQRLAGGVQARGLGVQHAAAIAQAGDGVAVEQVGVDAGDLGGHVGAQAHQAAAHRVDQLEGARIRVLPCPGQQRIDVFEHGRHHHLVAVGTEGVEHQAAQLFDLARFGRQDVGDILGQKPGWHGQALEVVKRRATRSAALPAFLAPNRRF
jgi:hypothetical protein